MKILAVDFGKKRIGLAISQQEIVSGLNTLTFNDLAEAKTKLIEVIREYGPDKIVVGMPSGNQQSEDQVRIFAHEINKTMPIPIEFTDELLTSKEAERLLQNSRLDPRTEEYKQEVDKISAKLILEQYLNQNK